MPTLNIMANFCLARFQSFAFKIGSLKTKKKKKEKLEERERVFVGTVPKGPEEETLTKKNRKIRMNQSDKKKKQISEENGTLKDKKVRNLERMKV